MATKRTWIARVKAQHPTDRSAVSNTGAGGTVDQPHAVTLSVWLVEQERFVNVRMNAQEAIEIGRQLERHANAVIEWSR